MQEKQVQPKAPSPDTQWENAFKSQLARTGDCPSVRRLLSKYGNIRTKTILLNALLMYFLWLREKGLALTPDQLIEDNLRCVFESGPTEVAKKRKHTDWLDEYVNSRLLDIQRSESRRRQVANSVNQFYKWNDSPLFGAFRVSTQPMERPSKPLLADDIRKVLSALPLAQRTPLLMVWQSGVEVNRILGLRWNQLDLSSYPLKLEFQGRKRHRRSYHTFLGRDAIEHLKMWKERQAELLGRLVRQEDYVFMGKKGTLFEDSWLNYRLRATAVQLFNQRLIANGDRRSWRSHLLRHSFETEASHAQVRAEIRDFFMGHLVGVQWVYNHRDEVHPEELVEEYVKIEPQVSLNRTEVIMKGQFDLERKSWLSELVALKEQVRSLMSESTPRAPRASGGPRAGQPSEP